MLGITSHALPLHANEDAEVSLADGAKLMFENAMINVRATRVHEYTHMNGELIGPMKEPSDHTSLEDA